MAYQIVCYWPKGGIETTPEGNIVYEEQEIWEPGPDELNFFPAEEAAKTKCDDLNKLGDVDYQVAPLY